MEAVPEQATEPAVESIPEEVGDGVETLVAPLVADDSKGAKVEDTTQENTAASLHVSNLSRNVTENHLREIFGYYGVVTNVVVQKEKRYNLSAGSATITFASDKDAEHALFYLDNGQIDGNCIKVSFVLVSQVVEETPRNRDRNDSGGKAVDRTNERRVRAESRTERDGGRDIVRVSSRDVYGGREIVTDNRNSRDDRDARDNRDTRGNRDRVGERDRLRRDSRERGRANSRDRFTRDSGRGANANGGRGANANGGRFDMSRYGPSSQQPHARDRVADRGRDGRGERDNRDRDSRVRERSRSRDNRAAGRGRSRSPVRTRADSRERTRGRDSGRNASRRSPSREVERRGRGRSPSTSSSRSSRSSSRSSSSSSRSSEDRNRRRRRRSSSSSSSSSSGRRSRSSSRSSASSASTRRSPSRSPSPRR